jgi:hypothetical protein
MRWACNVLRTGEMRTSYKILVRKLGDLCVDGRMMIKWMLWEWGGRVCTGFFCLRTVHWQAFMNTAVNLKVPSKARKFLTS